MISSRHFGNVSVCTNCELILVFRHTPQNFWPIRGRNWSEATQSSMNFQSIICPITYHSKHPRVWIHDHKNPIFCLSVIIFCQSHGKIIFLKTQPSCFNYLDDLFTITLLNQLHHHSSPQHCSQQYRSLLVNYLYEA